MSLEIDNTIDGVKLALISNRLEGISRKMGNTLMRTGRSGVLNIARDFSCCILTGSNELVAVAESLPKEVEEGALQVDEIDEVSLQLVWDPPWTKEMMSDAAKLELNL